MVFPEIGREQASFSDGTSRRQITELFVWVRRGYNIKMANLVEA
jgi:hypothetical protein